MPHFFEKVNGDRVEITGENLKHIVGALRMKVGEKLTLCDDGINYNCELISVEKDIAIVKVLSKEKNLSEPDVSVTIYQCMPKGDKLELVIQKAVELGADKIVPVLSSRCVSRPDDKRAKKKNERYNKIALSACEQSGRGKLVEVAEMIDFNTAVKQASNFDLCVLFYEGGGKPIREIIKTQKNICVFIGPEGGFSDSEVEALKQNGAEIATLGKRILRTETAPLAALVSILLLSGNME